MPIGSRVLGIILLTLFTTLPSIAGQERCIRLNLEKGLRFTTRIGIETSSSIELQPSEFGNYRRDQAVAFDCEVIDKRSNGNVRIKFQYTWVRDVYYSYAGDEARPYDSADPNSARSYPYDADGLQALLGQSFVAEVTPRGRVWGIEGFDRLYSNLHDAMTADTPTSKIKMTDMARRAMKDDAEKSFQKFFRDQWPLSEKTLTETVQACFVVWPQSAVELNVTWHTEEHVASVALSRSNAWTIKEGKEDITVVELLSHVRTDANLRDRTTLSQDYATRDALVMAYYVENNLAGQRHGKYEVDSSSGLSTSAMWAEELRGDLKPRDLQVDKNKVLTCPAKRSQCVSVKITNKVRGKEEK
jgi:hypothetical protein